MSDLTQEYAQSLLEYDLSSGDFRWRVDRARGAKKGQRAGAISPQGYVVIGVDRQYYRAHRLAFLMVTGQWPIGVVDHINGLRSDNRFANLRDVTQAQNSRNQIAAKNNRSGFKGVHWHIRRRMWCASIRMNRKLYHLGYFETALDAAEAYNKASVRYHGRFGRPSAMLHSTDQTVDA